MIESKTKKELRNVKIPKQDYTKNSLTKTNKDTNSFQIEKETLNKLKEVFDLFANDNSLVNPHDIRNGLRKIGKNNFII